MAIYEDRAQLKNLELNQDKKTKKYYLSAIFRIEDAFAVKELTVPRIALDINGCLEIGENYNDGLYPYVKNMYIDMGFGNIRLEQGKINGFANPYYYALKTIEEKTQEMTLSEIEKKLGYKIKLVDEKEG